MEILPSDPPLAEPSKAADGGHVPGACNTLCDFVRSLEDGQFDADAYAAIKRLSAALTATAMSNGGQAKGSVTISLARTLVLYGQRVSFSVDLDGRSLL